MGQKSGFELTGILTTSRGRSIGAHRLAEAVGPLLTMLADVLDAVGRAAQDRRWDEASERFNRARRALTELNEREQHLHDLIASDELVRITLNAIRRGEVVYKPSDKRRPQARVRRPEAEVLEQVAHARKVIERARVEWEQRLEAMRLAGGGRKRKPNAIVRPERRAAKISRRPP